MDMTICLTCNRYFMDAATCTAEEYRFPDGTVLGAVPYEMESTEEDSPRCPDCGVADGGYHHPGCAVAVCPRCGETLVTCGCLDAE